MKVHYLFPKVLLILSIVLITLAPIHPAYAASREDAQPSNPVGTAFTSSLTELHTGNDLLDIQALLESHQDIKGPLFSDFFAQHKQEILNVMRGGGLGPDVFSKHSHFKKILPDLTSYVKTEYAKDKTVFFHARNADWDFLQMIFRSLYDIAHHSHTKENFLWLRYDETPRPSVSDIRELIKNRTLMTTLQPLQYSASGPYLLFATLNPFANNCTENPYYIALLHIGSKQFQIPQLIENMFKDLKLEEEFKTLIKHDPSRFKELYTLYDHAITYAGNVGSMLVISMPDETADRIAYLGNDDGYCFGNGAFPPSIMRRNFNETPFLQQFCIFLGQQISTPEQAAQHDITMKVFNPAFSETNPSYQAFKIRLAHIMTEIKTMHDQRQAAQPV